MAFISHILCTGLPLKIRLLAIMELLRSSLTVYPLMLENLGQHLGCDVLQWYRLCLLGKDIHRDQYPPLWAPIIRYRPHQVPYN